MARLGGQMKLPYKQAGSGDLTDLRREIEDEQKFLKELMDNMLTLPTGQVVGAVLQFPMGDGAAYYLVTKASPLTVEHIPVGDAWHAGQETIRGINKDTALRAIKYHKNWAAYLKAKGLEPN